MTVSVKDVSNYAGAPVMLYEFSRRSVPTLTHIEVVTYWRYTSADRDFVLDGHTYTAAAISDDGIRQSGDTTADQLSITMPHDAAVPQMFVGSPPSDPIYCIIRHANVGETDSFLAWAGIVGAVQRPSGADLSATILCGTVGATMDRTGLRLAWSRLCPHDLYGFECRADPTLNYVPATVTAKSGDTVTSASYNDVADGGLTGGFLEWIDGDGHANRLGIIAHTGTTIRVLGTTDKLPVSTLTYAFRGCNRSRQVCNDVFDNMANHGGHAYMPDLNPFSGDMIF